MSFTGRKITSTLAADGTLTVALVPAEWAQPTGWQVLVRVEASPINPSDLGALLGPADLEAAEFSEGRIVAQLPEAAQRAMAARVGIELPVGNECAGTVVAAGEDAAGMVGKRVACVPGTTYATYAVADARACMVLPDSVSIEQAAAAFVNPLTALGFVETMRSEGFTALVHTAAASNLGQMLVKLCASENVPLVNVVRSPAQAEMLRSIGAVHVLDSSAEGFAAALADAVGETGAMLGYDAIGGGKMAGTILTAMEQAASKGAAWSRYGSDAKKKVYIYGALDLSPTVLNRSFGFAWELGGWLLFPFLQKAGPLGQAALREKVFAGITTTFASSYKARVPLERMLDADVARAYNAKRTGEKYLVASV